MSVFLTSQPLKYELSFVLLILAVLTTVRQNMSIVQLEIRDGDDSHNSIIRIVLAILFPCCFALLYDSM